jgi:hypothetical protein
MKRLIEEYCDIPRTGHDKTCEKVANKYFSKDIAKENYLH